MFSRLKKHQVKTPQGERVKKEFHIGKERKAMVLIE